MDESTRRWLEAEDKAYEEERQMFKELRAEREDVAAENERAAE